MEQLTRYRSKVELGTTQISLRISNLNSKPMHQVLLRLPVPQFQSQPDWWPSSLPIFGFASMLVLAFVLGTWVANRRARREGIPQGLIQDLAIWIIAAGVVGARIVYMIQYRDQVDSAWDFFKLWNGGL